ncbi:hypothetical protein GCM10023231_06270 [Olivibacter ginsenosidimutans]|uniref:Glycosyltransferase 2-like domain-containing protein n=1 Tax=Olivibacter ginsenosidimutans TaxID=1176537 RepID=A0ABP9AI17_9SPHI
MKQENPLVSVIIPCYNHEKYIAQCIESVVQQTYPYLEIFVLDDGSTDGSFAIIQELSKQYGFFAETHANKGLSATLNKGIQQYARGKYVCIVASDDYWERTKVEKQVAFYEKHPDLGFIFGRTYIVNEYSNLIRYEENLPIPNYQVFRDQLVGPYHPNCSFEQLIYGNFIPALTVMIRRSVFDKIGYFDEKSAIEDWDMWVRIAHECKYAIQDEFLGFYRVHASNISNDQEKMQVSRDYLIEKWKGTLKKSKPVFENILLREIADSCVTDKKRAAKLIFSNMHLFFRYKAFRKSFKRLFLKFRFRKKR